MTDKYIRLSDLQTEFEHSPIRDMILDRIAALPAVSAPGVRVKPLVWEEYPNPAFAAPDVAVAVAPFNHRYQVQRDPWAHSFMAYLHPTLPITSSTLWWESKGHITLDAAKAAAQADYGARILAALEPAPDALEALVKAAGVVSDALDSETAAVTYEMARDLRAALAALRPKEGK